MENIDFNIQILIVDDSHSMLRIIKKFFEIMARESLHGFDNSLYGRTLQ